jgi:hypothetical protein
MDDLLPNNCTECKYAIMEDEGYSNYTVEGRYFSCAKALHPDGGFDAWYGTDDRFNYGAECPGFVFGMPVFLEVEWEDAELTDEEQAVVDLWGELRG